MLDVFCKGGSIFANKTSPIEQTVRLDDRWDRIIGEVLNTNIKLQIKETGHVLNRIGWYLISIRGHHLNCSTLIHLCSRFIANSPLLLTSSATAQKIVMSFASIVNTCMFGLLVELVFPPLQGQFGFQTIRAHLSCLLHPSL